MNEDAFNMSIRKFLKTVGVTAQREIEAAVRKAVADGRLKGGETLKAEARIVVSGVALEARIEGEIALA
jgi:hypothetical protein